MALVACVLWLAGVEALPSVHEAMHALLAPHHHDAGAIILVSFEEITHRHPDGTIHYASPRSRSGHKPVRDGRSRVTDLAGHAAGLAHHAAAIAPPAAPILYPLPVDRRPSLVTFTPTAERTSRDAHAATARSPPTFA
jgi:hypothetical protein